MNMLSFYNQLKKKASVAEWSIATDCKSVDESLRWFKSNPAHTFVTIFLFTFFVLFSAITVNVSAQFPYNLDLDNSGENAMFETENVDNPNFTLFFMHLLRIQVIVHEIAYLLVHKMILIQMIL